MIVLAGGIGAGKSVVARILRLKGFGVYDCDFEARRLMESDATLRRSISKIAGNDVYLPDGTLNRKVLAIRIFASSDLREAINAMVHHAVRESIGNWLGRNKKNVFVETAIAAQSGIANMAEEIWLVVASEETRLRRVGTRDERTPDEIRQIMLAQAREERLLAESGVNLLKIENDDNSDLLGRLSEILPNL